MNVTQTVDLESEKKMLLDEIRGLIEAKIKWLLECGASVWEVWDFVEEVFDELDAVIRYKIDDILVEETMKKRRGDGR